MNEIVGVRESLGKPTDLNRARLWEAAHQLEGVFLSQLFRVMRETIPEDEGMLSSSAGEEVFAAMYDEVVSQLAAKRIKGGLGDQLFRQLSQRLETE